MEFVDLMPKHENDLKKLFPQLTGHEHLQIEVEKILENKLCKCAVLETEGRVVGFGMLVMYYLPTAGMVGKIEDIIVDEKMRGQGLGRQIVQRLIEIAKENKLEKIMLTSSPRREAARSLYASLGFKMKDTHVFILERI